MKTTNVNHTRGKISGLSKNSSSGDQKCPNQNLMATHPEVVWTKQHFHPYSYVAINQRGSKNDNGFHGEKGLWDSVLVSLGWDDNLSFLSSPHTQLQVLIEYFITVHSGIIQLQKKSPAYNFPRESYMLSVSHNTFQSVSIQSAHVPCLCLWAEPHEAMKL